MFVDTFAAIVEVYALSVYICLCRYANSGQAAWPSVETISRKVSISRRQVIRALQVLEARNIIAVDRKNGMGNTYFLLDRKCWIGTSAAESPVTDGHRSSACQSLPPMPRSHRNNTNGRKPSKNNNSTRSDVVGVVHRGVQEECQDLEEDILKRFKISPLKLVTLIVEHGRDKVRFYTERIDNQYRNLGAIKNPGGLLVKALRDGWFEHSG
ncbi:MAG: helix-turn-helix domain-containing protein [Syntrophaceae bacterium]